MNELFLKKKQDQDLINQFKKAINKGTTFEESLKAMFNFFGEILPLDSISVTSSNKNKLRFLAVVTQEGTSLRDETVLLSDEARESASAVIKNYIIFYTPSSPLQQNVAAHFKSESQPSVISLVLSDDPNNVHAIALSSQVKEAYHEEHADLLRLLREPVSALVHYFIMHVEIESRNQRLLAANEALQQRLGFLAKEKVVGANSGLRNVIKMALRVAPMNSPVLIMGETGVGKEVIANLIHLSSTRSEKPFISINCGAIPDTLLDSELFGHEKGAFTDAIRIKRGFFEQAEGGTIFMDEVSELPLKAQVRLLRILETMEFQRVGSERVLSVDVRVIAATNRDLPVMVKDGLFREDLWFRLNVFPILIPPLRQRKEDIRELAEHFAATKTSEMNLPLQPGFSQGAFEQLQAYDWPGNVRELQNIIERELILSNEKPLSFPLLGSAVHDVVDEEISEQVPNLLTMDELVTRHIRKNLQLSNGKINGPGGAAELLGINPSTLRSKMKKLGIQISRTLE